VPYDERATTSESGDPDPAVTAGLNTGGGSGVQPGDTPPNADQMSGAAGDDRKNTPNMGPVAGNRTPMIVTLVILGIFVVMVAVIVGASFIPS
jgi:hypothetical protein